MGKWFDKLFKRESQNQPLEVHNVAEYYGGAAPVNVNSPTRAMKIAAVYRAVAILSDTIAKMPLCYKRKNAATGHYVNEEKSQLYWLLKEEPNAQLTPFVFMQNLVQEVLLYGNAYVFPRMSGGECQELVLLDPNTVMYDVVNDKYTVADLMSGVSGTFSSAEILHFKGRSLDGGHTGVSVIRYAATTLGIAATGDKETGERFASGGKMKAIYQQKESGERGFSSGKYQDTEMRDAAEDIDRRLHSSAAVVYVPGDGTLTPYSMSSTDLQLLDNRKFTVTEIARFFGVPRAKIMDDSSLNYKSAELVNADLYGDGLSPIMAMIEQEFKKKMIPRGVRMSYKIAFDVRPLYAADPKTKAEHEARELANGVKTVNDLRREDDLPPVKGGDKVVISANLVPLETLGQYQPKKEGKKEEEDKED